MLVRKVFILVVISFLSIIIVVLNASCVSGATKTASSGNWSVAGTWSPSGVPAAADSVVVPSGITLNMNNSCSVNAVYVASGGTLNLKSGNTLTLSGSLTVNGTVVMTTAGITFASGKSFTLGPGSSFTWEPLTNTLAAATLFTNGIESFSPTSTLIIKKWYDYTVPIGSVITGNFGNLTLNSLVSTTVMQWPQQNYFSTHQIQGTLIIDQGWIVLDKTGALSSTTIGNIVLENANSYLDLHNGTHPGLFTVTTGNITVTDGRLNGILNGNGNVSLTVTGSVTLNGAAAMVMINNNGIADLGNGNATLTVGGSFIQNSGNFFGIYNATSTNAGTSSINIAGDLVFGGGTFMVHYGCHTGSGTSSLTVAGNTNISFSSNSDEFAIVGVSTLSSAVNSIKAAWKNTGNVSISGNAPATFVSSAGSGIETDSILGSFTVSGGTAGFNWPAHTEQSHPTSIYMLSNVSVTGGDLSLSYFSQPLNWTLAGNFDISDGVMTIKKESGNCELMIEGTFNQSGGTFNIHDNNNNPSPDPINLTVQGDFTQSAGTFSFENASSSVTNNSLTLNGARYTLSGSGTIRRSNAGSHTAYALIYFNRQGTITMKRLAETHQISQVKMVVNSGCILNVASGNLQIASHTSASTDYLRVSTGATLVMNTNQISSNGISNKSGLQVDSGGVLTIQNVNGFYDGTNKGFLKDAGDIDYYLDPYSIIEYNGIDNQVITGIGVGAATTSQHKYGILRINFNGAPNIEYTYLNNQSKVYVRTQLILVKGELNLNGNTLTLENGGPSAVSRMSGYVKSETNAAINPSIICWKNMRNGEHQFPFGVSSSEYIPVLFNLTAGSGNDVSISTRATFSPDNKPWSGNSNVPEVSNFAGTINSDESEISAIDRWWNFVAQGVTATVTVTYRGVENTISSSYRTGSLGIQPWDGTQWRTVRGSGTGVTTGTGTVTVTNMTSFSPWVVASYSWVLPIELVYFKTKRTNDQVELTWATATETNNDHFVVERSADGKTFESILTWPGAGNSSRTLYYSAVDQQPGPGYNYYRLRQIDYDGKSTCSEIETVNFKGDKPEKETALEIISVAPNPFREQFTVNYKNSISAEVEIRMMNAGGQTVFTEKIMSNEGMNKYDFTDQNGLDKGYYFLLLVCNGKSVTQKLIKN